MFFFSKLNHGLEGVGEDVVHFIKSILFEYLILHFLFTFATRENYLSLHIQTVPA